MSSNLQICRKETDHEHNHVVKPPPSTSGTSEPRHCTLFRDLITDQQHVWIQSRHFVETNLVAKRTCPQIMKTMLMRERRRASRLQNQINTQSQSSALHQQRHNDDRMLHHEFVGKNEKNKPTHRQLFQAVLISTSISNVVTWNPPAYLLHNSLTPQQQYIYKTSPATQS